jgi:hypothetical protein
MIARYIAPIVQGHGDVAAVPVLLRRIATELRPDVVLKINTPIRVKANRFTKEQSADFRKFIMLASAKVASQDAPGCVLILLDCEDDCPAELGPKLLGQAHQVRPDMEFIVALAFREYETWFITAAQSLQGRNGLLERLVAPSDPEAIRDAKGWLTAHMGQPYDPVIHQASFTQALDFNQAMGSGSFARLFCRVSEFFRE